MRFSRQLQAIASTGLDRARDAGLPVERAHALFAARIQPHLLKHASRFVIPFVRRTGVRIKTLEPGRVVCTMPLRGNVNHIGTMYAGALFTLAEFPGGPLMLATFGMRRFVPIVTALDMEFVKVAKTDVSIMLELPADEAGQIETQTLAEGESAFVLKGTLTNANGQPVAYSTARYIMRPKRR